MQAVFCFGIEKYFIDERPSVLSGTLVFWGGSIGSVECWHTTMFHQNGERTLRIMNEPRLLRSRASHFYQRINERLRRRYKPLIIRRSRGLKVTHSRSRYSLDLSGFQGAAINMITRDHCYPSKCRFAAWWKRKTKLPRFTDLFSPISL